MGVSLLSEKELMLVKAGERLKELRGKKGESVHKVARAIHISGNYLSELERGLKSPSDVVLESLASYYTADISEIFSLYNRIAPSEANLLLRNPSLRKIVTQMSIDKRIGTEDVESFAREMHKFYENLTKGK